MSSTNDFRQVRCNVAQCGRRRRKYNQVGIGAITQFGVMCTESGSWSQEDNRVLAGLLHVCNPIRVVAPENNSSTILCPQTS